MPVRVVVYLSFGASGFRMAGRPGTLGMDYPRAFEVLEHSIEIAFTLLRAHPPSEWIALSQSALDFAVPRLGEREGYIDCMGDAVIEGAGDVVLRACFPFRVWPLGGWVVYEGRHLGADGSWTPFTEEEQAALW
jgi:hypothetical protein